MPKKILTKVSVMVNAVDLSNLFHEIALNMERDENEVTGFQATHKEYLPGLADATIEGSAWVDYGATSLEATLYPLMASVTPFPVVLKPDNAAVSVSNPSYTMQSTLYELTPLGGSVGEPAETDITFRNADPAGVVRATT